MFARITREGTFLTRTDYAKDSEKGGSDQGELQFSRLQRTRAQNKCLCLSLETMQATLSDAIAGRISVTRLRKKTKINSGGTCDTAVDVEAVRTYVSAPCMQVLALLAAGTVVLAIDLRSR